jgi:2-alkyl-3-oxoalkanoate reductase
MASGRKALVTGAGGFVGRPLVEAFRAAGWQVAAAGRAELDVTDAAAVRRRMEAERPDAVINLAAIAHRKRARITAAEYDAVNHRGVRHLLDAAKGCGVSRFVQFSSAAVYGYEGRTGPVREDAERRPVGAYARSKAQAEDACLAAADDGLDVVVARFPALYAPGWVLDVRKRAYLPGTGVLLEVTGPGAPRHSLCSMQDVLAFALLAAEGLAPGVYNVADAAPYPQAEVAAVIGALDGARRRVRVPGAAAAAPLAVARLLPGGPGRQVRQHAWKLLRGLVLDTARARAAGFAPRGRLRDLLDTPVP